MNELQRLRDRVEELESILGVSDAHRYRFLDLTMSEAQLFGMLVKRMVVTRDSAWIALFGGRPECEQPEPKIIDVMIAKMRPKLKRSGVDIETLWGSGWRLSAAIKSVVASLEGRSPPAKSRSRQ